MKTNRSFRRLAIIVGTLWIATQAPVMANAPMTKPVSQQAQVKAPEQPRIILASTTCTRVGNRMVC